MKWIKLKRSKIKVFGKPAKMLMKGMTAPEEHTHFLHSLLTNNVKALEEGSFNYNLWLRPNGQPVADFFVYRFKDHFLLDTEKPAGEVIEEFEKLKLSLKVFFEDITPRTGHLFIFGEGSAEFIKDAFGVSLENFRFVQQEGLLIGKNPLRVGEEGYDVIGDTGSVEERLSEEIKATEEELEDLRIRNRVPRIGKELREGFSPLEAGVLDYAIDMNKGCYVGQEAIARVYFRGRTPRLLAKMSVSGDVSEGSKLYEGSKSVGLVTSVSPLSNVALGYVLRSSYGEGKELTSEGGKVRLEKGCS